MTGKKGILAQQFRLVRNNKDKKKFIKERSQETSKKDKRPPEDLKDEAGKRPTSSAGSKQQQRNWKSRFLEAIWERKSIYRKARGQTQGQDGTAQKRKRLKKTQSKTSQWNNLM